MRHGTGSGTKSAARCKLHGWLCSRRVMRFLCFRNHIGYYVCMRVRLLVATHSRHRLALQGQGGEQQNG